MPVVMCLRAKDWKFYSVVSSGAYIEIEGIDIWMCNWNQLNVGTLDIPHPSFPEQKHTLWINYVEKNDRFVLFGAGELSNDVWCFYIPQTGQPNIQTRGMTVNERLWYYDLSESFDRAINSRDKPRASDILILSGLTKKEATESVDLIFTTPDKYGYT